MVKLKFYGGVGEIGRKRALARFMEKVAKIELPDRIKPYHLSG
jgi:hypothetical protein